MSKFNNVMVLFKDGISATKQDEHLTAIRKAHASGKPSAAKGVTYVFRYLVHGYAGSFTDEVMALIQDDKIVRGYQEDTPLQWYGMKITDTGNWGLWRASHKGSVVSPQGPWKYVCQPEYGQDVPVYVIDTGLNNIDGEFDGRDLTYFDAIRDPNALPMEFDNDEHTHGTLAATFIAGQSLGAAKNCKLILCKFTRHGADILASDMINAVSRIAQHHETLDSRYPSIVNCSWGHRVGGIDPWILELTIRKAIEKRLIFVAAAGNDHEEVRKYVPARMAEVITVGSTDHQDRISSFSNYGPEIDIYAPGEDLPSIAHPDDPERRTFQLGGTQGTSFSAPLVSGIIACIMAAIGDTQRVWDTASIKAELNQLARRSEAQNIRLLSNGSDMA